MLFYANRTSEIFTDLSEMKKKDQLFPYLVYYSFKKEWGYNLFVLKDYDLVLIDLLKLKSTFKGYELKASLSEALKKLPDNEIETLTLGLLKKFTLIFNGINVKN